MVKNARVYKSLPRQRHYIASRGVRTAIYLYAVSVSETQHVLRYYTLYFRFLFFRRCKDKEFSRNYQTFLNKNLYFNHFLG